jgi:hypothetical protein
MYPLLSKLLSSQEIRLGQARQKLHLTVLESFLQRTAAKKKNPVYSAHFKPPFTSQFIGTKVAASNQAGIGIMLLMRTNLMHVYCAVQNNGLNTRKERSS